MTSTTTTPSTVTIATGTNANLYLHARYNFDTYAAPATDMPILAITRSTGGSVCALMIDSATGRFQTYTNAVTVHASMTAAADTTYYIWLESIRNTSCLAYISTNPTKPEDPTITSGTVLDYDSTGFKIGVYEGSDIVVDHIRVNTSAFGSNPQ
jgi:hypothetical protein